MEVLIETLWNVKIYTGERTSMWRLVLIETLWNVKELSGALKNVPGVGFNRNIVECKVD